MTFFHNNVLRVFLKDKIAMYFVVHNYFKVVNS